MLGSVLVQILGDSITDRQATATWATPLDPGDCHALLAMTKGKGLQWRQKDCARNNKGGGALIDTSFLSLRG